MEPILLISKQQIDSSKTDGQENSCSFDNKIDVSKASQSSQEVSQNEMHERKPTFNQSVKKKDAPNFPTPSPTTTTVCHTFEEAN